MRQGKTNNAASSNVDIFNLMTQPFSDMAANSEKWPMKMKNGNLCRSINTCLDLCLGTQQNGVHLGLALLASIKKACSACSQGSLTPQELSKIVDRCMESSDNWVKAYNQYFNGQAEIMRQFIATLKEKEAPPFAEKTNSLQND